MGTSRYHKSVMEGLPFPDKPPYTPPWARARKTDPETSHEAARAQDELRLRLSQGLILTLLQKHGPMSDEEVWSHLAMQPGGPPMSRSGARTRRKELVSMGYVEDSGLRATLPSGRQSIVWRVKA